MERTRIREYFVSEELAQSMFEHFCIKRKLNISRKNIKSIYTSKYNYTYLILDTGKSNRISVIFYGCLLKIWEIPEVAKNYKLTWKDNAKIISQNHLRLGRKHRYIPLNTILEDFSLKRNINPILTDKDVSCIYIYLIWDIIISV